MASQAFGREFENFERLLTLARQEARRFVILDGMKDPALLHQDVLSHLPSELRRHAL